MSHAQAAVGAWFAGWGYMRFWEPKRDIAPHREGLCITAGDGDDGLLDRESAAPLLEEQPTRTMLGASPAEIARARNFRRSRDLR